MEIVSFQAVVGDVFWEPNLLYWEEQNLLYWEEK
jgi:hypothetical protein